MEKIIPVRITLLISFKKKKKDWGLFAGFLRGCWSYHLVSCCKIICTSRFYWRYLILTQEALIFICSTWLWCPEGVTISVWGDSKGNAAHSRQQAKTDRSNKNQCITSYQSLQQPSPHSFLPVSPANHTSLSASITFALQSCLSIFFHFFFYSILTCQFILLPPKDKVPHLQCTCDFYKQRKSSPPVCKSAKVPLGQGVKLYFFFLISLVVFKDHPPPQTPSVDHR